MTPGDKRWCSIATNGDGQLCPVSSFKFYLSSLDATVNLPSPYSPKHRPFRTSWVSTPLSVCMFSSIDLSYPYSSVFYLERCNRLSPSTKRHLLILYYSTYVPFDSSSYPCSRPCTFIKSVALSSALALPSSLVCIIS